MDGERAAVEKKRLVFVVDENPFEVPTGSGHVNRFSVLVPLMTTDGERLDPTPQSFPNRGRVWWLIRDTIATEQVTPGSLWTGPIESALKWDPARPDTDKYQAKIHDIQPGFNDLVEVIPVAEDHPPASWAQRGRPIPWPRPTTAKVFLAGRKSVLGPLRAKWDPATRLLTVSADSTAFAGGALMARVDAEVFARICRVERFDLSLQADKEPGEGGRTRLELTRNGWFQLAELREHGETLDGSPDLQIINWATRLLGVSRGQAQPIKELLERLDTEDAIAATDEVSKRKRERLREIAGDVERVTRLGEEVAEILANHVEPLGELVRRHADKLAAARVEAEVARRREEVDAAIAERSAELDRLSAEHAERLERHRRELDEIRGQKLEEVNARLEELRQYEEALRNREEGLQASERAAKERMDDVLRRYHEDAERFGSDLLAAFPVLRRLGLGTGAGVGIGGGVGVGAGVDAGSPSSDGVGAGIAAGGAAGAAATATGAGVVSAPGSGSGSGFAAIGFAALGGAGPRRVPSGTPTIDEGRFLAQFAELTESRGFVFSREDLINFHVTLKAGGLTILAGPSGTGKSSLPRLYAEALGWDSEYLHVPVRPDWLDDRDLVGAFNVLAQRFEPAASGLVERLIAAAADLEGGGDGIHLVCLDEMNLARVEHYFAQFLSVMELPDEQRRIALFAPGVARAEDPYAPFRSIPMGENLRFLGTVNIDETTHFFSPKVLDRAQVVAFPAPDLGRKRKAGSIPGSGAGPSLTPVPFATWRSWIRRETESSRAREFVLRVNEALLKSRQGLGYRQFDRMLSYVESARLFFSEDAALDYQLAQIVLPRLRPTAPGFGETLRELRALAPRERFPRASAILGRMADRGAEDDFFQLL